MLDIKSLYESFQESAGISIDTRTLQTGQMYCALRGDRFDGHRFVDEAIEKGAIYCVVEGKEFSHHAKCIHVPNVLTMLQRLASYHRNQFQIPILAITGSNGKTTTKELVHAVLSRKFRVLSTKGNLNNHIGVPLTLLRLSHSHEIAIIEMGANHEGEIQWHCHQAAPTHGLVTNIGQAHLEGYGDLATIQRTKFELYHYLAGHGGQVLFNEDEPSLSDVKILFPQGLAYRRKRLFNQIKEIRFSKHGDMITFSLNDGGWEESNLFGSYNEENILTAAAVASYFEMTDELIAAGISDYSPTNNRSQIVSSGSNLFYLDAYNANPTSMAQALHFFDGVEGDDKMVILGDMLELGSASETAHRQILNEALAIKGLRKSFLVGPYFSRLHVSHPKCLSFATTDQLIEYLKSNPIEESKVLIKGSRALKLERIYETESQQK